MKIDNVLKMAKRLKKDGFRFKTNSYIYIDNSTRKPRIELSGVMADWNNDKEIHSVRKGVKWSLPSMEQHIEFYKIRTRVLSVMAGNSSPGVNAGDRNLS